MIFNSLFTQLLLAALGLALIFVYIQPTLTRIAETRDSIELYKAEQQRVSDVNKRLALLVNEVNSISPSDQRALLTYMPDQVDDASVSRDIFTISQIADVEIRDIKASDTSRSKVEEGVPVLHTYDIKMNGPYDNVKQFLSLLEQNDYPLEVHELVASAVDNDTERQGEDDLLLELKVVTYSRI